MNQTSFQQLELIVGLFPEEIIGSSALLLLSRAWIMIYSGRNFQLFETLDELAEVVNDMDEDPEALNLRGELNTLISYYCIRVIKH